MKPEPKPIVPLILIVALVGGCMHLATTRLTLPASHTVVRGQLVVHSDFPVASTHRLLEELTARRMDLSDRLGIPVSEEPIHVYLFDDADRFGGFIRLNYPDFPPRRAYFLETDTRLQVYAQWGDRVAEDLRHEVTHGYLHCVVPNLPLWLDEGLAEFFEVPRGHGGLNRMHLDWLSARAELGEWQPGLARLETLDRPFEMTQGDYAEAWAWVHFLSETGPERRGVMCEYLSDLRLQGSAEPLSERLGRRFERPEEALVEHVRRMASALDR
ncbi:MAG: hypothetical protein HQ582_27320 [Planctomycetes bacterium]|nr:hypothetical protein [Planctomycetota bacterium]